MYSSNDSVSKMRKLTGLGGTMETSKVTSKTSSLKALLLKAWRERWSDLQWAIHIKTILPRGVSGDVYNLADCILQQALVGPGPNQLVLSYLKHSLSSQLVSYAAVLLRISKFEDFHKPHCTICLLEFLVNIMPGVTCRGKPEEGILAGALMSLVHWLLQCYHHGITNTTDYSKLIYEKSSDIICKILISEYTVSMLYLAKHEEDKDLYSDVVKKCHEIERLLSEKQELFRDSIQESLIKLCNLELGPNGFIKIGRSLDSIEPLNYTLQAFLAVEVLLNPSSDTNNLVNKLLMIQRIKGYSNDRLYAELIRGCLLSLNDVLDTSEETQWGAFTFLKLPHVLHQLHLNNSNKGTVQEFSQDIADALELLLRFTPLDILDARCACNTLECLLNELKKLNLLTDMHVKHYVMNREGTSNDLHKSEPSQTSSIPIVIVKAEPTLARLLKTLDAEYGKIQEALLSMLCQVLTGKSFELILAVATVEGKLKTFVSKLIKYNEFSKHIIGDNGRASQIRAMLFDVTFLMLCSIVQTHGSEVVLGDEEHGESFFAQWVRECIVERGKPKSPANMLKLCDPIKVDALLAQFNSSDSDFKNSQMKWHEVCVNIPGAIKEVLVAWDHGALSTTDVKRILDAMRARMCCLPVCAATWLCSYMQVLHQDALLKPMNMVQQFLNSSSNEESSQQDNFKERSSLMFQIIRKMQYEVHPPSLSKNKVISHSYSIISKQPISEQLHTVWSGILQLGWLKIEATHILESLLNTGGTEWFVANLIKEVLKFRYKEDLDRALDLVFALFHLDIVNCTILLLLNILPNYLHNKSLELIEPQTSAVAKLCAYCVFSAFQAQANSQNTSSNRENDFTEDLDEYCPTAKLMRLDPTVSSGAAEPKSLGFLGLGASSPSLQEPLQSALKLVFDGFSMIVERSACISEQTLFVFKFFENIVLCGKDKARFVLKDMPNTLVPYLVRELPDLFNNALILRLYDLESNQGRKSAARDLSVLRNMALRE